MDIFERLENDQAYIYSVEHNDAVNLQMVLRAYKYPHTLEFAEMVLRGSVMEINTYLASNANW